MTSHRLYQAIKHFDPEEIDRVFGNEDLLCIPDPSVKPAPVKRVAIFAESFLPKIDGVSKSAYLTLRYLQQTGREVVVFAPDTAIAQVGPSKIIGLPSVGLPFAPETRLALPAPHIHPYLDEFQPDMIHLFSPALMCVNGMQEGRRRHTPVIANYQTDLPGYARQHYGLAVFSPGLRYWLRFIHNRCHLTLVGSMPTLNQLRADGYHRLRLWRRGVDIQRFHPNRRVQAWRERLLNGRDPVSLLCIYVGRLAPEKRVDLLSEVARTPGVALSIVGDGPLREELEAQFAGTGTFFAGYLVGDDLAHAYASADVFLFPGPNETFGQVVQEAMASGLPAVVINQGGVTDLVTHGGNGLVCQDNPRAFVSAVTLLRENPSLRAQMARESRRIAEQRPWQSIMAQLENYYKQAVALNARFNRRRELPKPPRYFWPTYLAPSNSYSQE